MQTPNLQAIDTIIGRVVGSKGDPGDSPEITVTDITGGHRVTITIGEEEPIVFDVMDGEKGDKGDTGDRGDTGDDGVSPTITITNITGGHRVTITDAEHPLGQSIDVMDGQAPDMSAYRAAAMQDVIDQAQSEDISKTRAMIAPVEASTTASAAHAVGTYFRLSGTLYIATAAIAVGDTITAGTNCRVAVLGNDVSGLKRDVNDLTTDIAQKADSDAVYSKEAVNARDDALYAAILTGGGDYKATMKSFFLANGANATVDLTALCDRWYTLSRTGWTGGVRFPQPEEGVTMSSDGTKTGDNAGLSCTPSTTTEANRDDYAALPLFAVVECNVTLDADGKPHVTAIDGIAGGFARSDPAKIVCCMQMTGWMHFVEDEDVFGFDYTDQPGLEGFVPLPEAVELKDNAVRSWVVHCKYGAGDAWGSCSGVPLRVWDVSHNSQLTDIRNAWGNRYCGFTSADDAFLKRMLYIKYAHLDSDRVLHGCVSYNYDYAPALAETGVERILVTPAQAATLIVGSTVCYGASARAKGSTVDRKKITAIETVNVDGTDYGAIYVDNGGTTFDTATNGHLTTTQWWTGSTDAVQGNDGGINPTNDRYPVKLQGIEIISGCYEAAGDTIFTFGSIDGVQCQIANVCRDAAKLATSPNANYKASAYGMPLPAASAWQWPKRLGHDPATPEVMLGSVMGASSGSGTRDGCHNEQVGTTGLREWLRWGRMYYGLGYAGLSCCNGRYGLGFADWTIGGRLSVTGNRGEYQAAA